MPTAVRYSAIQPCSVLGAAAADHQERGRDLEADGRAGGMITCSRRIHQPVVWPFFRGATCSRTAEIVGNGRFAALHRRLISVTICHLYEPETSSHITATTATQSGLCDACAAPKKTRGISGARLWASRGPHADLRLRADARGSNGGIREELAATSLSLHIIRSPRRRGRAASAALRGRAPSRS
jgi:hypothetical protein